jgi:tetratricopeptide (TPR) repeat protein
VVYAGYEYRGVLFFWKYNIGKLDREVTGVETVADRQRRLQMLRGLVKGSTDYKNENPLSAEAFLASGHVHYLLGEAQLPARFTELLITDRLGEVGGETRELFIASIKDLKKATALSGGSIPGKYLVTMGKSSFITGYYGTADIAEMLSGIRNPEKLEEQDDRRFIAMVHVLNNNESLGFDILNRVEQEAGGDRGSLFLATVYRIAKKYTNAIMEYRKVLDKTQELNTRTLIHFNLGRIYFTQALYGEALREFVEASAADSVNTDYKIWAGKSYAALGDKVKARETWMEAFQADKNNTELKKLIDGK